MLGVGGGVRVEVAGGHDRAGSSAPGLEGEAEQDADLQLAVRVLGGQVVAVRPDREAT